MNKKLITLAISGLGLIFAGFAPTTVFAEPVPANDEVITGTVTIDDTTDSAAITEAPVSPEDPAPSETPDCLDENGDLLPNCNPDGPPGTLDEGLADEPEVVCSDEDEPDCADPDDPETLNNPEDPETSDPALWPLILSLSVLGGTILFVLIINFAARKK